MVFFVLRTSCLNILLSSQDILVQPTDKSFPFSSSMNLQHTKEMRQCQYTNGLDGFRLKSIWQQCMTFYMVVTPEM